MATVDGQRRHATPGFAAPYAVGHLPLGRTVPPQEEWAPGMVDSLRNLRRQVVEDGWIETGGRDEPWSYTYRRARGVRSA